MYECSVMSDSFQLHGLPGFSVHGISQARILEWVAISFSISDPGIEPKSPALAGRFFTTESPRKPQSLIILRTKWLRLLGSIQCLCSECHQVTCENSPSSFYLKFLSHDFNHKIDNSQINIEEWSQWSKRFGYFFKDLIWWQITLVV